MMEDRKQEEIEFHNRREQDRTRLDERAFLKKYSNKKYYSITRQSKSYLTDWMLLNCPGKVALDYCCGLGLTTLELAKHGALAYGVDISDEEIKTAAKMVAAEGYGERASFRVMDAERLEFEDSFFDLIICNGVLHHLDLNNAYPELARVLKPDGQIICIEALGYNPAIKLYRKMTPHLRTEWEAAHILKLREVRQAEAYFNKIGVRFFHLFSILAVPLRKTFFFEPALKLLEGIDAFVLRIPLVQLMAWQMIFVLSKPKSKSHVSLVN